MNLIILLAKKIKAELIEKAKIKQAYYKKLARAGPPPEGSSSAASAPGKRKRERRKDAFFEHSDSEEEQEEAGPSSADKVKLRYTNRQIEGPNLGADLSTSDEGCFAPQAPSST